MEAHFGLRITELSDDLKGIGKKQSKELIFWRGGGGTMYTHVSKCKNNKINFLKRRKTIKPNSGI
jgi:hypothetical protein